MTSMSSTPPIIVRGMSRAGSRSSSPADRACPPTVGVDRTAADMMAPQMRSRWALPVIAGRCTTRSQSADERHGGKANKGQAFGQTGDLLCGVADPDAAPLQQGEAHDHA